MGLGLFGRHAGAGHLLGLCAVGARAGTNGRTVCAGHHAGHSPHLCPGGMRHLCTHEGTRQTAICARALKHSLATVASNLSRSQGLHRFHATYGLCSGLSRRCGCGHYFGCHLRRTGHWISAARNHGPYLCVEHCGLAWRFGVWVCARSHRSQIGAGDHFGRLEHHLRVGSADQQQRSILVGGCLGGCVHGF